MYIYVPVLRVKSKIRACELTFETLWDLAFELLMHTGTFFHAHAHGSSSFIGFMQANFA